MNASAITNIIGAFALGTLVILPFPIAAAPTDEVVRAQAIQITDGDSITVVIEREMVRARLAEIDAPEGTQPFAIESKESLYALCFWADAELTSIRKDYYGRTLADVKCNGVDVSAEQVRRGLAWVKDQSAHGELNKLQEEARAAKRGLWSYESPIPPWEWRPLRE